MDDQSPLPPPIEPEKGNEPAPEPPPWKLISLFVAFAPSLAALAMFNSHTQGSPAEGWGLLAFTVICCIGASIGMVHGMKDPGSQAGLAFCLSVFFFIANVVIAVLIGCSQMGSIG